jgi:hypothetical protein
VFSVPLWLNKRLLNRRDAEGAERKKEILLVTLKGLCIFVEEFGIIQTQNSAMPENSRVGTSIKIVVFTIALPQKLS